jgi:hypothetical protein
MPILKFNFKSVITQLFQIVLMDLEQGSVQAAVLDGLGDVVGGDVFSAFQVGNGAGDFEDAGVGTAVGVERPSVSQPAVI